MVDTFKGDDPVVIIFFQASGDVLQVGGHLPFTHRGLFDARHGDIYIGVLNVKMAEVATRQCVISFWKCSLVAEETVNSGVR